MPIYEFKCQKCEEFIELLVMNQDEKIELKCPKCNCEELERVLSSTSYSMGDGSGKSQGVKSQTRTCQSGSCTTYEIPGHTR
ncbi:MAG: zinc ribbon domain-containing protein [Desulfobacterales bacterium]|jgi:putative FmdB family regulatory protein|nr:zinc ribbon domain-containing protein [Desulfobacterales bacterium]